MVGRLRAQSQRVHLKILVGNTRDFPFKFVVVGEQPPSRKDPVYVNTFSAGAEKDLLDSTTGIYCTSKFYLLQESGSVYGCKDVMQKIFSCGLAVSFASLMCAVTMYQAQTKVFLGKQSLTPLLLPQPRPSHWNPIVVVVAPKRMKLMSTKISYLRTLCVVTIIELEQKIPLYHGHARFSDKIPEALGPRKGFCNDRRGVWEDNHLRILSANTP